MRLQKQCLEKFSLSFYFPYRGRRQFSNAAIRLRQPIRFQGYAVQQARAEVFLSGGFEAEAQRAPHLQEFY